MNTNRAAAVELAAGVAKGAPKSGVQVGVAPPFVYQDAVAQAVGGSGVLVGAQDLYFEKSGAFTGEISADMLKDVGARFVLTGHSERRHVLGESPKLIGQKAHAAYAAGLILVHCVGEKLEERDAGRTFQVVQAQLEELSNQIMQDPDRLVIAYEPVWAIGTGRTPTVEQVAEVHGHIRRLLATKAKDPAAVRILYGGSVKPSNAKELMSVADVDGALVGGASLVAADFWAIAEACS